MTGKPGGLTEVETELVSWEDGTWSENGNAPIKNDHRKGRSWTDKLCVRTILISAPVNAVLCTTAFVMIMITINGRAQVSSPSTRQIGLKAEANSFRISLRHASTSSTEPQEFHSNSAVAENATLRKRRTQWNHQMRNLESILIKLENVNSKYDEREEDMRALYSGLAGLELNKIGQFQDLLPERKRKNKSKCRRFKTSKELKKWTLNRLSDFQCDVERFNDSFQKLIKFEESPLSKRKHMSNASRLGILKEFKTDLQTLNLEIFEMSNSTANKRLNFHCRTTWNGERPDSQTNLIIYEWRIIKQSEKFLKDWSKILKRLLRCWEKWKRNKPSGKKTFD